MKGFSIGEVEKITSVKAHTLRYWEESIPSLAPQKDMGGRRLYSNRDVQTFLRLKYLIQEKKYTIEGAREALIAEAAAAGSACGKSLTAELNRIKSELLDLYRLVRNVGTETEE
ncbi:MerR family transcriptional regulator [Treponema sp. HNW]|uniref:MerR family transcriptional regulator n=1 Tax=unclassified Treponema TaxID=2638727 RepID=UPI003D0B880F